MRLGTKLASGDQIKRVTNTEGAAEARCHLVTSVSPVNRVLSVNNTNSIPDAAAAIDN